MTSLDDLYAAATEDLRAGRWERAIVGFDAVLRSAPAHPAVLQQLGVAHFQAGNHGEAVRWLEQAAHAAPGDEAVWNNLGVVREGQGQWAKAAEAFQRAVQLNPTRPVLQFNLGNTWRHLGRHAEAEGAYRRAVELEPRYAEALHNWGALRREMGDRHEAERLFQAAVALAPGMVEAQVNLGSVLQSLGRNEEALACYRAALRVQPDYADAQAGEITILDRLGQVEEATARVRPLLAGSAENPDVVLTFASLARGMGETDHAIELLQKLLGRSDLLPAKRQTALFALGKLCDAAGRYEEAFAAYRAGNEMRSSSFDLRAFREANAEVRKLFTRERVRQLPRAGNEDHRPIFVVGMPRSGTSLIEQILASHPAIFGAGELTWLDDLTLRWGREHQAVGGYPECLLDLGWRTMDAAAREYLALLSTLAPEAQRVVDKMPGNFAHLGLIHRLFPQARVIHITRDPLDTCLSCYFQNFTEGHYYTRDLQTLGAVYREYEALIKHWMKTLLPAGLQMVELRYEDVVENQEYMTRELLRFCGLEWDPRCLDFHTAKRVVHTASYDQVRRPIYRDSVGRATHYEQFLSDLKKGLAIGS